MCSPAEIVDALLKLHKNAWKDALRFVVEQSLKDHTSIAELNAKNHELASENSELRERLAAIEPVSKPWFEIIISNANAAPDTEPVFLPTGSTAFGEPRMKYSGSGRPNIEVPPSMDENEARKFNS